MHSPYRLSEDIHACQIGDAWIFLDVGRDRYFCLVSQQATWFTHLVDCERPLPLSDDALRFAEHLRRRGILSSTPRPASRAPEIHAPVSTQLRVCARGPSRPVSRWRQIATLTRGMVRLGHLQTPEKRNLKKIIQTVQGWKHQVASRDAPHVMSGLALSQSFHALSPWFFTSRDACFFRSLLLVYFLARYDVLSDWTFAVRLSPFRAHCWVSAEGLLLNEDPDIAAGYTPVLTL